MKDTYIRTSRPRWQRSQRSGEPPRSLEFRCCPADAVCPHRAHKGQQRRLPDRRRSVKPQVSGGADARTRTGNLPITSGKSGRNRALRRPARTSSTPPLTCCDTSSRRCAPVRVGRRRRVPASGFLRASILVPVRGVRSARGRAMMRRVSDPEIPQYHEFLWPTLQAVSELGGSASISEIVETVIRREGFTDQQQAVLHNDGPNTEIAYRLAWARSYLKGMGLLTNSARAVWTLTDEGTGLLTDPLATDEQRLQRVRELWLSYMTELRKAQRGKQQPKPVSGATPDPEPPAAAQTWKEQLLDALMEMQPGAFERLAKRLLREADFASVNVTGQSGDGGIDGLGVYRLGLVSFPVFFQCKRYQGSVSPGAVRDFRGAMAGRGDKGLLITTGTFTADAKKEATRDGAPTIDLIDGDRLCELLKRYELGTVTRLVEEVTVNPSFFAEQ